jgi:hypothetical protein
MKIISLIAAGAVAFLSLSSVAFAGPGDPIPGVAVGLEHDPEGITIPRGTTDPKGNATFARLERGRYMVFVPDLTQFKRPVAIAISVNGAAPVASEPMTPGKGKGYAMDKAGRKMVFALDKPGTPFVVTIVER